MTLDEDESNENGAFRHPREIVACRMRNAEKAWREL